MSDRVVISIADGIADVRLNRPDKRNALDREQFASIAEAGERLKSEPGVRVVVLSGEGESFCAGLDFSIFGEMAGGQGTGADRDRGNPGAMSNGSDHPPRSADLLGVAGAAGAGRSPPCTDTPSVAACSWRSAPTSASPIPTRSCRCASCTGASRPT